MKLQNLLSEVFGRNRQKAFAKKLCYEICPSDYKEKISRLLPCLEIEVLTAEPQAQTSTTTQVEHVLELKR